MIAAPACLLYTQDSELARRVRAYLRSITQLRHVQDPDRFDAVIEQTTPALLLLDLRAKESRELLDEVRNQWPDILLIALGTLRSEPLRDAEESGIYAAEDVDLDRRRFQGLVLRALDHLRLLEENRDLRAARQPAGGGLPLTTSTPTGRSPSAIPSLRLARVFSRFTDVEALLNGVVETIADAAGVTRVGVFSRIRQGGRYRLRAGLRCLPETSEIEYGERDPLVRWFERHAHLISRTALDETSDRSERLLLRRALDNFGAEVVVPLYARGRIIGWLFFGHRLTGQRFGYEDLQELTMLADQLSAVLENALLYEEVTVQKTLAETLLKNIPPGILATDEHGIVRWFNPTAEYILGVESSRVLNKPVETAGGQIAGFIRDALDADGSLPARRWVDNNTHRSLSIETRRLADRETALGAVAVIHDVTEEESSREKRDLLDRAAFWNDLAASMSHEIRNPLVAIKTFAQLLPERFDDADFREEFSEIVVQEIDRLDKIITQINTFAHPPEMVLKPIDVRGTVSRALEIARKQFNVNGKLSVETSLPNDLPKVLGDESALAEAFAHIVANAAEASSDQEKPRIVLTAKPIREGHKTRAVVVTVRDNGKGIDPDLREKVFSPFCTTKPRGIGLGLPIVKRTVFDHNGRVDIDSSAQGTEVSVTLPANGNGR